MNVCRDEVSRSNCVAMGQSQTENAAAGEFLKDLGQRKVSFVV